MHCPFLGTYRPLEAKSFGLGKMNAIFVISASRFKIYQRIYFGLIWNSVLNTNANTTQLYVAQIISFW